MSQYSTYVFYPSLEGLCQPRRSVGCCRATPWNIPLGCRSEGFERGLVAKPVAERFRTSSKAGARGRNRTGTDVTVRGILSPLRLPVPPPGRLLQLYHLPQRWSIHASPCEPPGTVSGSRSCQADCGARSPNPARTPWGPSNPSSQASANGFAAKRFLAVPQLIGKIPWGAYRELRTGVARVELLLDLFS